MGEHRPTLQGVDVGLSRANLAGVTSRLPYLAFSVGVFTLLFFGCNSRGGLDFSGSEPPRFYAKRFYLMPGRDVGQVLNGNTFLANLHGVHPLFGENVPVRIRGVSAPMLPPANNSDLPAAIVAWQRLRQILENAREVELRLLERGQDDFYVLADVYVDGDLLEKILRGRPSLSSD